MVKKAVKIAPVSFKLWVEDEDRSEPLMQLLGVEHLSGDLESLQKHDLLIVRRRQVKRGGAILMLATLSCPALIARRGEAVVINRAKR